MLGPDTEPHTPTLEFFETVVSIALSIAVV